MDSSAEDISVGREKRKKVWRCVTGFKSDISTLLINDGEKYFPGCHSKWRCLTPYKITLGDVEQSCLILAKSTDYGDTVPVYAIKNDFVELQDRFEDLVQMGASFEVASECCPDAGKSMKMLRQLRIARHGSDDANRMIIPATKRRAPLDATPLKEACSKPSKETPAVVDDEQLAVKDLSNLFALVGPNIAVAVPLAASSINPLTTAVLQSLDPGQCNAQGSVLDAAANLLPPVTPAPAEDDRQLSRRPPAVSSAPPVERPEWPHMNVGVPEEDLFDPYNDENNELDMGVPEPELGEIDAVKRKFAGCLEQASTPDQLFTVGKQLMSAAQFGNEEKIVLHKSYPNVLIGKKPLQNLLRRKGPYARSSRRTMTPALFNKRRNGVGKEIFQLMFSDDYIMAHSALGNENAKGPGADPDTLAAVFAFLDDAYGPNNIIDGKEYTVAKLYHDTKKIVRNRLRYRYDAQYREAQKKRTNEDAKKNRLKKKEASAAQKKKAADESSKRSSAASSSQGSSSST